MCILNIDESFLHRDGGGGGHTDGNTAAIKGLSRDKRGEGKR